MCHNLLNHHFRSSNNPIIGQLFHLIMLHKQQQGEQQGPQWPSSHQAMIIMKNITWSSVLYTTARWSAAPPVATKLSSSPTPSSITFLCVVIDLILLVVFMMVAMMITKIMSGNDWSPFCAWKINFCKVWSISADCFVWSFLRKIVFLHGPVFLDAGDSRVTGLRRPKLKTAITTSCLFSLFGDFVSTLQNLIYFFHLNRFSVLQFWQPLLQIL